MCKIIMFNLIVLVMLFVGVFYLNFVCDNFVDECKVSFVSGVFLIFGVL